MISRTNNFHENVFRKISGIPAIKTFFVVLIFFPIFFQLTLNLYTDSSTLIKSGGGVTRLPIPFSVPACFFGIFLFGGFRKASLSWIFVFSSFFLMIFTSIVVSGTAVATDKWKLLLFQYLPPMFAFILGYCFESKEEQKTSAVEKGILLSVGSIVLLQLLSTWLHRDSFFAPPSHYPSIINYLQARSAALHDKVFFFSIYQHLQYVPCVLVSAFFIALYSLWGERKTRYILFLLTPFVGVYSIASTSKLALGCYLIGLFGFVLYSWTKNHLILPILLLILSLLFSTGYFLLGSKADKGDNILNKKLYFLIVKNKASSNTVKNKTSLNIDGLKQDESVSERLKYWRFYINHITDSAHSFFFGHPEQPNIKKIPSAHNYYLDFIYNFGFLAFLPLLLAVIATIGLIILNLKLIYTSPSLLGLTFSVLFLLFADNSLKVGMRLMYPGIATFFLWGLLLNRLQSIDQNKIFKMKA